MPCGDVTEVVQLRLDAHDRLAAYEVFKLSCGRGVGQGSLLPERVLGMSLTELLLCEPESLCETPNPPPASEEEGELLLFLAYKQAIAVQETLRAVTGQAPSDADALCTITQVAYDAEGLAVEGHLSLDHINPRAVRSCTATGAGGGCGSCGS